MAGSHGLRGNPYLTSCVTVCIPTQERGNEVIPTCTLKKVKMVQEQGMRQEDEFKQQR